MESDTKPNILSSNMVIQNKGNKIKAYTMSRKIVSIISPKYFYVSRIVWIEGDINTSKC